MRYVTGVLLALALTAPEAFAQDRPSPGGVSDWSSNANASVGVKALSHDDWGAADTQGALHLDFDTRPESWPISLAAQMTFSTGEGTENGEKVEGQTQELNLGVRKIWAPTPGLRPFLGGGLALVRAEFTALGESDSGTGAGVWVGGGAYWNFQTGFNLGVQADWTKATVTISDTKGDAGGAQLAVMGGFHF